ncbi:MAG TPA: ABC transporter substrate-binding protein [Candidatus Limnocylindria bacterium]|nr:ABC transporter substrate-binding protein [Candidatus Limnocylindria bacterium]
MKLAWFALILLQLGAALPAFAQKLMLAHVAVNPSQGMLHLAKDSGILAKYGLSADVLLIPGTPRTIQALIAGDLDYVAAGAPASLRARAQGADVTILSTLANSSAQRVFVRPDSKLNSFMELKGKIVGVTQYGSGGDTFLRGALRKHGIKESEVTILQMGGTPGVAQGLESGRIEVGVLGDSGLLLVFRGRAKPLKGASAREMGFRGVDAPLTTTDRKIKADRGAVIRFMQAYLETVHFFLTKKPETARLLAKYMRGVSEEHISLWCDDLRATIRQVPYPDEEALRTELEMMNIPGGQIPPGYINNGILDEIKKSGFIDKLYKQ